MPDICLEIDRPARAGDCGAVLSENMYAVHIPFYVYLKSVGLRVPVDILVIHAQDGCALVDSFVMPPVIVG